MTQPEALHELEQGDYRLPDTGRPVVRSTKGVISSGHYLTSMAGMRMLLTEEMPSTLWLPPGLPLPS